MASELVSMHLGQAGIRIGNSCWELYCKEHSIDYSGTISSKGRDLFKTSTLFSERADGTFSPRSIFMDLEPSIIDELKKGDMRKLFNPDYYVSGKEGGADCYTRGYLSIGPEILAKSVDKIRKVVEECESFQGFITTHSVAGGTGSGFCHLLFEKLGDLYPKKLKVGGTLYSDPNFSCPIEPYNTILASECLVTHFDLIILYDNVSLYRILSEGAGMENPRLCDINRLMALSLSSLTATTRFLDSELRVGLDDIRTHLVPFKSMHFLIPNLSSIIYNDRNYVGEDENKKLDVDVITKSAYENDTLLLSCDPRKGKYICSSLNYFGDIVPFEVNKSLKGILGNCGDVKFVDWLPRNTIKVSVCCHPACTVSKSSFRTPDVFLSMFSNNTCIAEVFKHFGNLFDELYFKQAFTHNYTWYLSKEEFSLPREVLESVEYDYKEFCDASENPESF